MTFYYFCSWYVQKGICTFQRFLFLNFYAFLLLFGGIGIGVIPLYQKSLWYIAPQLIFVIICIRGSIGIFSSWEQKKREYSILFRKNEKEIRPGSFSDYMQAPCGRLLTIIVLYGLGRLSYFKELRSLRKPFIERLKDGCAGQETVVTIYKQD